MPTPAAPPTLHQLHRSLSPTSAPKIEDDCDFGEPWTKSCLHTIGPREDDIHAWISQGFIVSTFVVGSSWLASSNGPWCLHAHWQKSLFWILSMLHTCCDLLHVYIVFCCVSMCKVPLWFMCICYRHIALMLHKCSCNVVWIMHNCWIIRFGCTGFLLRNATLFLDFSKQMRICYIRYFLLHRHAQNVANVHWLYRFTKKCCRKMLHSEKILREIATLIGRTIFTLHDQVVAP
jgi:hypothetical protein